MSPLKFIGITIVVVMVILALSNPTVSKQAYKDLEIKVGIVQRFGATSQVLTISTTPRDILSVRFPGSKQQWETVETPNVKLEVQGQPQQTPILQEYLVLSDHGTFETAEDSAKQWQAKGIKVEITQPERWQVWAKRDVYSSPFLRRALLANLVKQGYEPRLATKLLQEKPVVSFVLNGVRYNRNEIEISSKKNLVQVQVDKEANRSYEGTMRIQPNAYGDFTLVNQVGLESYLRGVVPYEIGPEAPEKATEAQTIIARTYALRNLRRFQADNYEMCATIHCQVYYGLVGATSRADRAIVNTKGLVLTYNNELVDALYSSTTGGVTASFGDTWNGEERPYLKAVIDAPTKIWDLSRNSLAEEESFKKFISIKDGFNETGRKVFRWQRTSTIEEINKDVKEYLQRRNHPMAGFTFVKSVDIIKRSPSGRILQLDIKTDLGTIQLYKTEVRSAFTVPRSTLFYIEPLKKEDGTLNGYTFIGGGFGHGVGLSQFGSYNLAQLGWSVEKILKFYYPGTTIQSLNPSIVFYPSSTPVAPK